MFRYRSGAHHHMPGLEMSLLIDAYPAMEEIITEKYYI
jgi:hypothetical protein